MFDILQYCQIVFGLSRISIFHLARQNVSFNTFKAGGSSFAQTLFNPWFANLFKLSSKKNYPLFQK